MRNTPAHVAAGILVGSLVLLLIGLPVTVVLGTLGGGWGEQLLGAVGVPIGILLTLVLVPVALFAVGGAIGGGIAWALGCLVRGTRPQEARRR
jgi:hypothetical protein